MAFVKAPTSMWPGYTSNGTTISIPISVLEGLTAAEAHTTDGDWRNIMLAICSTAYSHYKNLPTEDRPTAFQAGAPQITAVTSGLLDGTFRTIYSFTFLNDYAVPNVADEPA